MDTTILRTLRSQALLRKVSPDELEYIASFARVASYDSGAFIFHESQPRRFWGFVTTGRVELRKGPRGRPRVVFVLGPGASFGESGLLDDYPHSTSGFVVEPTTTIQIPRDSVARIAKERPELYARLVAG